MLELKVCAPTPGRVFIIVVIVVTIINLFGGERGGMTALEPVWKSTGFCESTLFFNSVGPRDLNTGFPVSKQVSLRSPQGVEFWDSCCPSLEESPGFLLAVLWVSIHAAPGMRTNYQLSTQAHCAPLPVWPLLVMENSNPSSP